MTREARLNHIRRRVLRGCFKRALESAMRLESSHPGSADETLLVAELWKHVAHASSVLCAYHVVENDPRTH